MIKIGCPNIDEREIKAVVDVLRKRQISTGEIVEAFEKDFARYIGKKFAVAVSSGSVAMELAIKVSGLKRGDRMLVSPFNCAAILYSILNQGLKPEFVDIDEKTYNIFPNYIKAKPNKAKGLLAVHLYGQPCQMNELLKLSTKYGLILIEDISVAPGATYKGRKVGTFGSISICSFGATKNLTTAEGGMILTDDRQQYEKLKNLRSNISGDVGYPLNNYRMNDIQAAIGREQLRKYEEMLKRRRSIAKLYFKNITNKRIKLPFISNDAQSAFHSFVIRLKERDRLQAYLFSRDIETSIVFKYPLHKFSISKMKDTFPVTERCTKEILSLPIHSCLTDYEISKIVQAVNEFPPKSKITYWKNHFEQNAIVFKNNIAKALDCSSPKLLSQIHNEILKDIKFKRRNKILDIGSGAGLLLSKIDYRIKYLFQVDIAYHLIKRGMESNNRIADNLYFINANIIELPFLPNNFDYVFCCEVLQYTDLRLSIAELVRVTKDDGYIFICAPNKKCPIIRNIEKKNSMFRGINYSNINDLLYGFKRVKKVSWKALSFAEDQTLNPYNVAEYKPGLNHKEIESANRFIFKVEL